MDDKDDLMARTMVENLSIGINHLTGRALSPSDCCANEVVQEAAQKEKKERRKAQYPNTGKAWSREESEKLYDLYFRRKNNIWQIANILKRTPGSVSTHLKKFGY